MNELNYLFPHCEWKQLRNRTGPVPVSFFLRSYWSSCNNSYESRAYIFSIQETPKAFYKIPEPFPLYSCMCQLWDIFKEKLISSSSKTKMASQPPPPPGQGRVQLPSASMARPQLTSWAPSPLDEPEPLPLTSGQTQRPSTSMRPSNSPTTHLQSTRTGGASQLPSYSQSGNNPAPPSLGQSNRPPSNTPVGYTQSGRPIQPSGASLGQHMQSQRVPSSSHHQNVGQSYSQSQRVPSNSQFQNVGSSKSQQHLVPSNSKYQNIGQTQSQRLPSNSHYQNAGQGNIGVSMSSSKYSSGQHLDPPGHTGMPTIPEIGRSGSESLGRTSSRSPSRVPTAQGGVSVMASRLDKTKRADAQSHMPSQLDITKSQISNLPKLNAPASQPSILKSTYDLTMASKQMNFASMVGEERQEQLDWAQERLKRLGDGCSENWDWAERIGGFQCEGGAHAVTDALLEEGKDGVYRLIDRTWNFDKTNIKGPYYKDENGHWVRVI